MTALTSSQAVATRTDSQQLFCHVLPLERLGYACASYEEFCRRIHQLQQRAEEDGNQRNIGHTSCHEEPEIAEKQEEVKEYSLVVVTETARQRILLGHKHRGFGAGMFNSFGGKLEPPQELEYPELGAQRELHEETGIWAPLEALHRVGTLHFTFNDNHYKKMVVRLFHIHVTYDTNDGEEKINDMSQSQDHNGNPITKSSMLRLIPNVNDVGVSSSIDTVRDDDDNDKEITPVWFDDWYDIPLHNMFADDSIWLTTQLLALRPFSASSKYRTTTSTSSATAETSSCQRQEKRHLQFDGWFHFKEGGTEVNSLLHYYLHIR